MKKLNTIFKRRWYWAFMIVFLIPFQKTVLMYNKIGKLIAFHFNCHASGAIIPKLYAQEQIKRMDSLSNQLEIEKAFNGNFLIAEGHKVIYLKSFGYADFTTEIKNSRNSAFQTGSVSKMFTAIAILQLIEQIKSASMIIMLSNS